MMTLAGCFGRGGEGTISQDVSEVREQQHCHIFGRGRWLDGGGVYVSVRISGIVFWGMECKMTWCTRESR